MTDRPERWTADGIALGAVDEVLALDLHPLALAWPGPALPGVRDAAAEAMACSDELEDETAHESSNAGDWFAFSEGIAHARPLVAPSAAHALAWAVRSAGLKRIVAVEDPAEVERIRIAERL